ncbi:SID1 transmembrane family member 1-like [Galleria mellonella]|uniref:SID1 transmembrane family member 1-like n=1 Tax=Galleria mellonella TaxID=7137 RepID=A0ABM3MCI6_GALME|nr:SID1 transmembrane family member 1-like [Galleria mellonella]
MIFVLILYVILFNGTGNCVLNNLYHLNNGTGKQFIYNTYKYGTINRVTVNNLTEQIMDFYEEYDYWHGYPTRVHVSSNSSINTEYPVFITAVQQKGVLSWELPLVVSTPHTAMIFTDMGRTLCPHDAGPNITTVNRPQLQVTTFSPTNVSLDIKLRRVEDFYIELDKTIPLVATPSTPKYYYFSFDSSPPENHGNRATLHGFLPRFNYTIPKSVILIIESDSSICATVSIQNNSCPVFDTENDVSYQGYHLTMTNNGGITLTQSMFPVGFYVVFIVNQNNKACGGAPLQDNPGDRVKDFRFRIIATISYKEYVVGALVVLALFSLVVMLTVLVLLPSYTSRCTVEVVVIEEDPTPSTSRDQRPLVDERSDEDSITDSIREWPIPTEPLTVAGLSKARPKANARRSDRYFWSALTVAVVYALPVVQLLFTYQQMVFQTGNQDLCYYNFLCAHPLGILSDFNHVYSNIGYVLLGLVFALQVRARASKPQEQDMGIPQHHGLFYSMGLALAMEGLLSACYHLCPNKMNFQFDSSFMYVIAVLCMVKLYQNRHPDVNASAHATFMLLALLISIGLFGIMYPSVYFWVIFTLLHLGTCFVLTLKIYYVGQFKVERGVLGRGVAALRTHGWSALRPNYTTRAILLALANLANWALAAYGLYEHKKDFARHLLAILMGNTILYTLFYIVMKLVHRERVPVYCWLYLASAHAAWFYALNLFLDSKTKWSETPAQSRRHNAQCTVLQFYDSHDAWHVASAVALYLSFNALLTVDDNLRNTPKHQIPVF